MSRRRLKKHLRYAAAGISIALTASLVILCGLMIMFRLSAHRQIGSGLPFGLALFTAVLILLVYRFARVSPGNRRKGSVPYRAVTELSKGEGNKTKSA